VDAALLAAIRGSEERMTDDLDVWVREARKQIRREAMLDKLASCVAWFVAIAGIVLVLHLAEKMTK
jgi:hypothetical protein